MFDRGDAGERGQTHAFLAGGVGDNGYAGVARDVDDAFHFFERECRADAFAGAGQKVGVELDPISAFRDLVADDGE